MQQRLATCGGNTGRMSGPIYWPNSVRMRICSSWSVTCFGSAQARRIALGNFSSGLFLVCS